MSRQITQPINQVRLTNVAVVRMTKNGKRFEVACYRNKIVNYRQGIESDLSEVLQTDRVFTNVSKGEFAKSSDLKKAFGSSDEVEVCKLILQKGQIQVSELERSAYLENTLREVAVMISEKCMNPLSHRPYTVETIRNAMKEAEFNVHPTKNVKQQFLECMKLLVAKNVIPIVRANMLVCAVVSHDREKVVRGDLMELGVNFSTLMYPSSSANVMDDHSKNKVEKECRIEFFMDPSLYRKVDERIKNEKKGRLEIIKQAVFEEGDVDLDSELARKDKLKEAALLVAAQRQERLHASQAITSSENIERPINTKEEGEASAHLEASLILSNDDNQGDSVSECHSDEMIQNTPVNGNLQKNQRKAQKKSKKAKRREKEVAEEREKRVEAERLRQEERKVRLEKGDLHGNVKKGDKNSIQSNDDGKTNGSKSCTTCGGNYNEAEFRAHFRSDFHRYNLKLKLSGAPCISEEEFLLCDASSFFDINDDTSGR